MEEQKCLVEYLDKKCLEIDSMVKNTQFYIQALTDFKACLISNVVTGKIDVRGIEIPEYEYIADEANSDTGEDADTEETDEQEE